MLLECHTNVALCQIRQNLFLHAIVTLTTLLQYSRRNAQAYYLRGKCYYCLFDYKSAYIDISECLEIHKTTTKVIKNGGQSYQCPGWLSDFHDMLGKKVSGIQGNKSLGTNMTPVTT